MCLWEILWEIQRCPPRNSWGLQQHKQWWGRKAAGAATTHPPTHSSRFWRQTGDLCPAAVQFVWLLFWPAQEPKGGSQCMPTSLPGWWHPGPSARWGRFHTDPWEWPAVLPRILITPSWKGKPNHMRILCFRKEVGRYFWAILAELKTCLNWTFLTSLLMMMSPLLLFQAINLRI